MAARKPSAPDKKSKVKAKAKAKKPAPKPSVLGNDPFARGSAVREVAATAPAAPPVKEPLPVTPELVQAKAPVRRAVMQKIDERPKGGTPVVTPPPRFIAPPTPVRPHPRASPSSLSPTGERVGVRGVQSSSPLSSPPVYSVDPRPHAGAPTAQTLKGPTAHASSPSIAVDPRPHAGAPTAQPLKGPTSHASSPSVGVDPRPHAGAPTAQPIKGPTPHAASPSVGLPLTPTLSPAGQREAVDPRPHAGAPTAQPLKGPTSHASSPTVAVDPRPHAGAPTAQTLKGPTSHASSPSVGVDPRPHAGAPTAQTIKGPTPHAASPSVGLPLTPTLSPAGEREAVDPRPHSASPSVGPVHPLSPSGERESSDPRAHAGAPTAQTLKGPTPHAGSPSLAVDPRPHAASPSVELDPRPRHPLAPARSSAGERELTSQPTPTVTEAFKGLLNAARTSAGLASRTTEVDRWGKDASLASSLRPLGDLLYDKYWRVRVEGAEQLPTGPCIIVANHAGALPLDGPVLHLALRRERPELEESRWLLEDQIFHAPFIGVLANRVGAVRANPENAMRLLDEGRPVIVFPEGFHGLSKPFSERYQLKRFGRGGYVKIALRAGVPIIPAAIVGGEESMPLLGKIPGGLFGVEYLPITLPPLPARWHIRFAAPVSMEGAPKEPDHDLAWVERKNLAVRDQVEAMLLDMLHHRDRVF